MRAEKNIAADRFEHATKTTATTPDLVCLSHLRWDFVYQRPQHLLSRFANHRRVFFVEEPVFTDEAEARLDLSPREGGLCVVVPHVPRATADETTLPGVLRRMLDRLFAEQGIDEHVLWYYTPMAIPWSRHLQPLAVVYDCMDELSAFKGAPRAMRDAEAELFTRADLVFTGGQSLYEAKREKHANCYCFPSSIDATHFARARGVSEDLAEQRDIPRPRVGYCGVIDERLDIELLGKVAELRPDWHFVMIGPVVKIDPAELPRRDNIHYLGGKQYKELPDYIAGWDVAMMPFARNDSTRFISPTKTPEYLAAGRPVVSTSIRDVVRPYGEMKLVHIADTPEEFVAAIDAALAEDEAARLREADAFLSQTSWDRTWGRMNELVEDAVNARRPVKTSSALTQPAQRAVAAAAASGD